MVWGTEQLKVGFKFLQKAKWKKVYDVLSKTKIKKKKF